MEGETAMESDGNNMSDNVGYRYVGIKGSYLNSIG